MSIRLEKSWSRELPPGTPFSPSDREPAHVGSEEAEQIFDE
ncbi:hypothetical protein chiPu_0022948, partial [Chiloscyllium punctatum]|nr:hypothetical protein [Chiloscyllium punctatum]